SASGCARSEIRNAPAGGASGSAGPRAKPRQQYLAEALSNTKPWEREAAHFDLASAGIASAMNGHHRSLSTRMSDRIFCRLSCGISLFGFAKSSRLFSTFDQN